MDQLPPPTGSPVRAGWNSLPTEIRLMIYSLTWEPRKVFLDRKGKDRGDGSIKLRVRSPPPVTLHLNFEAREATLRHYVPFFHQETWKSVAYFNPDIDVLFLSFFCDYFFDCPEYKACAERLCSVVAVARHIVFTGDLTDCRTLRDKAVLSGNKKLFPELRTIDNFDTISEEEDEEEYWQGWTLFWFRSCCAVGCRAPRIPEEFGNTECDVGCSRLQNDGARNGPSQVMFPLRACHKILGTTNPREMLRITWARIDLETLTDRQDATPW